MSTSSGGSAPRRATATMASPARGRSTRPTITARSCSTRTATTSRSSATTASEGRTVETGVGHLVLSNGKCDKSVPEVRRKTRVQPRGREKRLAAVLAERLDDTALGDQRDQRHHRAEDETLEPARDPHRTSLIEEGRRRAPPLLVDRVTRTAAPRAR